MRFLNENVFNGAVVYSNQVSSAIDSSYIINASVQGVFSSTAGGTLKLQGSNDMPVGNASLFVPTNWTDIASASVSVSGAGSYLVPYTTICHQYIRAAYVCTAAGIQTVTTIADTGVAQISRVICVADVSGSLNSKYFLLSSVNASTKVQKNFYVWYNINSAGVDPALPGKTGVEVDAATGATNADIATATGSALAALTNDFASATVSTATIDVVNAKPSLVTNAANGAASPGFTITTPTPGVNSNLNNKYFLLYNGNDAIAYYVWFNVASIGTDPAVAGKTAVPVAINASASASSIGGTMATAIQGAHGAADFTAGNSSGVVTVTNLQTGPFTPASDNNTGFAFALSTPAGTMTARLKTLGM